MIYVWYAPHYIPRDGRPSVVHDEPGLFKQSMETQLTEVTIRERPVAVVKSPSYGDRFLRNTWYVALWADELPAGKLVSQTMLGDPVLLFRQENGKPAAIIDRCSHSFAPLSMGKLLPGGTVQCAYHGLQFDGSGKCVKNPHGNCSIPAAAHLRSFPVVERHKLIWIWMGDAPPEPAKIPDFSCLDTAPAEHITDSGYLMIKAHSGLIVDNLLDASHTAYVHEGILGNSETVVADITVEQKGDVITVARVSTDTETPNMLKMLSPEGYDRGNHYSTVSWFAPSNLILKYIASRRGETQEQGTGYLALHFITPETPRTSHYRFSAVRYNVQTEGAEKNEAIRKKIGELRQFAFSDQDAPIIEAQQRRMDQSDRPLAPTLLAVDGGQVRYRRILDRMLKEEAPE